MAATGKQQGQKKLWDVLTILLLAAYLVCGVKIFRDYGASSDEVNQIEAGHITWTAVCEFFGKPAPDFGSLPKLKDYYNRYYGQAATFPTVIIEALKGFTLDVSTVLRLRHVWNFCLYFLGLICFGTLLKLRCRRSDVVFFALLIHIAAPKLFGDVFYNDRDVLLISLLWVSLLCFEFFTNKPGPLTALLCGFFFALTINTRFFGLVLILLPLIRLLLPDQKGKGWTVLLLGSSVLFFYIFSPILWGSFLSEFAAAFRHFSSGQQRTQETGSMAAVLFFGKPVLESDLPFWYLPLWMLISTPIIPQILTAYGLIRSFRCKPDLMDRFMRAFLCLGVAAVMIIRPVQYNGWRHLYFFYVPFFWFAAYGLNDLLNRSRRPYQQALVYGSILLSAGLTCVRMAGLHPYEYIYLNPVFSSKTAQFDRDYWRLSTTECLKWLMEKEPEKISVGEVNENLDNSRISLLPQQRKQLSISNYNALHRFPPEYLIFNYSGQTGNEKTFDLYRSVHFVERDGVKFAEIYQRNEDFAPEISGIGADFIAAADQDLETEWRSKKTQNPEDSVIIEFAAPVTLSGLSLLPGDDEREYARTPEVSISEDGQTWTVLPLNISGLFDLSFPQTETRWLRIRNTAPADVHWSIREILFYSAS